MEFKVRAVDGIEQKSVQEVESELLEKHEQEVNGGVEATSVEDTPVEETKVEENITQTSELSEDDVLYRICFRLEKRVRNYLKMWLLI